MKEFGIVLENVSLKYYNTYKIGGNAKYIVKPSSVDNLINLIEYLKKENIDFLVIGKGSNIILPDEDFDGVLILLDNINKYVIKDNVVEVEAGIVLGTFIMNLVNNNLGGLEKLCGIPGTLGGAIVGNAGCYGSLISDYLVSVTYLENGTIKTISKNDCNFSYRDSIFKRDKNKIILSCKFELNKSNKEDMLEVIKENSLKRKNSQPLEYPNAGSVFRNPEGVAAGKLIEDLGLKNYNINGAYISNKHANFIINKDNAESKDIVTLIEFIQEKVEKEYGIKLILEQEIIKY